MHKKDDNLKDALDEIFGDDFIEVDMDDKKEENVPLIDRVIFTDYELEDEKQEQLKRSNTSTDKIKKIPVWNEAKNNTPITKNIPKKKPTKNIYKSFILIVLIITMILIISLSIYITIFGIEKKEVCELKAKDAGYNFSDTYIIAYKKNNIIKIKSSYEYNATDSEFTEQVKIIKESKLPVVINSNGMSGFTYIVEENDNSFKVNGYLDFEKMNFKEVDKQNYDLFPIAYEKINSKTTYNNFINKLKKQGYTCKNK